MAVVPLAAAFQEAFAHEAAGREREAMAVYRSILAAVPNHPGALLRIAESEIEAVNLCFPDRDSKPFDILNFVEEQRARKKGGVRE